MAIRSYGSIRKYDDAEVALSPEVKLLVWAYQNPEKALEIGAKIAAVGILVWFLGALFQK
jgi:SpoU rRNA methylase family enzyme